MKHFSSVLLLTSAMVVVGCYVLRDLSLVLWRQLK
jgi:hypothetical protein